MPKSKRKSTSMVSMALRKAFKELQGTPKSPTRLAAMKTLDSLRILRCSSTLEKAVKMRLAPETSFWSLEKP